MTWLQFPPTLWGGLGWGVNFPPPFPVKPDPLDYLPAIATAAV